MDLNGTANSGTYLIHHFLKSTVADVAPAKKDAGVDGGDNLTRTILLCAILH